MKLRDLLLPIAMALATTWLIQHFILNRFFPQHERESAASGKSFVAPTSNQPQVRPLNLEIDFIDTARSAEAVRSEIDTPLARYVFSTDGASLESLAFKRKADGKEYEVNTITPTQKFERENRCFLIAFAEKTPYYFTLVERKDDAEATSLTYRAALAHGVLQKKFIVSKKIYKIVLEVAYTLSAGQSIEARIFYPVPLMPELGTYDFPALIATNEKGQVQKISKDSINKNQGWYAPTLFGLENRYFVQAMVDDPQQVVQRAYVKMAGKQDIFAIVETGTVTQSSSYSLTFYFGPKEEEAMVAVDTRLPQVLEYYGWFAPISRAMLHILNFLYEYVHNYGLAIIILTFAIRLLMLPLTLRSETSIKKRGEMQRKLQYVQQRYKDDPETLLREKQEIIRKHGMPEFASCLPMLLQLPIAIGLQRILSNSIELYRAPFAGWITDLSAHDPYYVLPVFSGICMVLAAPNDDYKQQLTVMILAVLVTVVIAKFSAGLTLYVCAYNVFSVIQKYVQKSLKVA